MNKQIVLVAPNWLGDAVMALPAMRDVRAHFPDARLLVAARPSVAALFRAVPGVDEIVEPDAATGDIGILFPNSFRSAWLLKRAGMKERWGYRADFRSPLLTKAIARPRVKMHFGAYYQNLVRECGVPTGPLTPQVNPPKVKIEAAARLLRDRGWDGVRPLVALAPGAAFGEAKRWPSDRFAQLAREIQSQLGASCVIVGRSEDRESARGIAGIDLVGETDLLTLMGVLTHCRAAVCNDSGALHLAAAVGVPVTAMYGPTDQRFSHALNRDGEADRVRSLFEPVFCRPCYLRDCPIDHRCMKRISVERVFEAVSSQLPAASFQSNLEP